MIQIYNLKNEEVVVGVVKDNENNNNFKIVKFIENKGDLTIGEIICFMVIIVLFLVGVKI